jgi:RNA polymerase sigma factor (sigma-70 family)
MPSSASSRTDPEWITELRGEAGHNRQEAAHHDLANYLYVVAYNYLRQRQQQQDLPFLSSYAPEDLAALAEDFVQETLLKLRENDYARLAQFTGTGNFSGWVARVLTNLAASELRHAAWHRQERELAEDPRQSTLTPEAIVQLDQIEAILQHCLAQLDQRRRVAFEQCVAEDRRAKEVAELLETTENGVNQLVFRARKQLRECMEKHDIGPDTLALFTE